MRLIRTGCIQWGIVLVTHGDMGWFLEISFWDRCLEIGRRFGGGE